MNKDQTEKALREAKNALINFSSEDDDNDVEDPEIRLSILTREIIELQKELAVQIWLEQHENAVFDYYKERHPYIEGLNLPWVKVNDRYAKLESINFGPTKVSFKFKGIEFVTSREVDEYTIRFGDFSKKYSIDKKYFGPKDILQINAIFSEDSINTILSILGYRK